MSLPESTMAPTAVELPGMSGRRGPYRPEGVDEPVLPETEARLRCSNMKRLLRSFRMATESRWIAEWLLSHPTHPFHHHTSIPADSFENSLAIRAAHRVEGGRRQAFPSGAIAAGFDILLVPVAHSHGKLIGYSFGGLGKNDVNTVDCSFDFKNLPFFPHFVGRFAFDCVQSDLLVVLPRMNECVTGIMSIRRTDSRGRERERSIYGVANGSYGFRRLPARLITMGAMTERRLAFIPKYQFAVDVSDDGGGSSAGGRRGAVQTDMNTLREDLAKLERMVKGRFFTDRLQKDSMDSQTGELRARETAQLESLFDVKDAVGLQVFRDTAMRSYYSYMASISGGSSGSGSAAGGSSSRREDSSSSRRRR